MHDKCQADGYTCVCKRCAELHNGTCDPCCFDAEQVASISQCMNVTSGCPNFKGMTYIEYVLA